MYLGTQGQTHSNVDFETHAQLGVTHVCANPPETWRRWDAGLLTRFREKVESYGLSLDMIDLPLPFPSAPEQGATHVFLGPSPERDREIDEICELIRSAARAGIPAVKYNISILSIMRTSPRYGRGRARLSSFRYSELDQSLPLAPGAPAPADVMWERIDHFLERVVPVAAENKVRMACHPEDPGIGDHEYRGVARVMGTVEGLKRFVHMHESPYHGLNFCQGTVSEMLEKPGAHIYDVIRYFGARDKIFNVHFRNIKGGLMDFVEVFPDEGDVDMLRALRTYKEVGYRYMVMPDHTPEISGPEARRVAFAYSYGYIQALLQVVGSED